MKPRIKKKKTELAGAASKRRIFKNNTQTVRYETVDPSVYVFRDGQTVRPHRRRGTSTDPTAFKRAYVCKASGSMPEKKKDTRHPDLKRSKAIKAVTEPGAPRKRDAKPSFKKSGGINTKAPEWQRQAILYNLTDR